MLNEAYTNFVVREACEVCGSQDPKVLFSESFESPIMKRYLDLAYYGAIDHKLLSGVQCEIVECPNCGFIWQKYILNDNLMTKLYSEWIPPSEQEEWHINEGLDKYLNFLRIVIASNYWLKKRPHDIDVCEIGFGWGELLILAKGIGNNVYGVETSTKHRGRAEDNGINVIEWENISEYKFDLICAEQVLEHIPNPKETLSFLAKHLKKRGLIHLSVPDCNLLPFSGLSVKKNLRKINRIFSDNSKINDGKIHEIQQLFLLVGGFGHINGFSRGSLLKLASECNLKRQVMIPYEFGATYFYLSPKSIFKRSIWPFYRSLLGTDIYLTKHQESK